MQQIASELLTKSVEVHSLRSKCFNNACHVLKENADAEKDKQEHKFNKNINEGKCSFEVLSGNRISCVTNK